MRQTAKKTCRWCRGSLVGLRSLALFCSKRCRQSAFRARLYASRLEERRLAVVDPSPMRFAYADPPYPGTARRYYGRESSYRGEVDHRRLLRRLGSTYDGWALSTSARALADILPLCPREARVCAWVKPGGAPARSLGLHNVWEAVIVMQGRRLPPGRRDALYLHPARLGGELPGRKPLQFCAWLFQAMGMLPGDKLDDLFPGTGIVRRAWAEIGRRRRSTPATAR